MNTFEKDAELMELGALLARACTLSDKLQDKELSNTMNNLLRTVKAKIREDAQSDTDDKSDDDQKTKQTDSDTEEAQRRDAYIKEHAKAVYDALATCANGAVATTLARRVFGPGSPASRVNPILYAMLRGEFGKGIVSKTTGETNKPLWKIGTGKFVPHA